MAYREHKELIDVVMPIRGEIRSDGTWYERDASAYYPFAAELRGMARDSGQRYAPAMNSGHGSNWSEWTGLMENRDLWDASADNLVAIATETGYDAPWDGITYDAVSSKDWNAAHADYIALLSQTIRDAGLIFQVSHGVVIPSDAWRMLDLGLFADTADVLIYNAYSFPYEPVAFGPHWWAEDGIQHAEYRGLEGSQIVLGLGNFGTYWPDATQTTRANLSYDQIMALITDNGAHATWIELDAAGRSARERYAAVGDGYIWFLDQDVVRARLNLAGDRYLEDIALFRIGTGDPHIWDLLMDWKANVLRSWHGYVLVENVGLSTDQWAVLLNQVRNQGSKRNHQPCRITHWRALDANRQIIEAVWRDGELSMAHFADWLGAILGADTGDIVAGDYVRVTQFGGPDATWMESGDACRAWVAGV